MSVRGPVRYALSGVAAIAAYLVLPHGGLGQAFVFLGLLSASVGLLVRAVGRLSSERRRPWLVLLAGEAVYGVAWLARYLLPVGWHVTLPYPSILDAAFLCSYALFGVFLVLLIQDRDGGAPEAGWGGATLDALVAAAAAGAVVQAFLVEPVGEATAGLTFATAVSITYPLFLIGLITISLQLVFRSVLLEPGPSLLVVGWIGGELVADLWYAAASLRGSFHYGHEMFIAWMLSYVALGVLALHPRFAEDPFGGAARTPEPRLQLLGLGAAMAVPIALLAVTSSPVGSWQHTARAAWVAMTVVVVLIRFRGLMRDVELERLLRTDIERLATKWALAAAHDPLTGLANRLIFREALRRALAHRRAPGRFAALMIADIDTFKAVNDTYGHAVGDELLCAVAGRLRSLVRGADVVARLGGDEFAVVLDDADVRSALVLADRVVVAFAEPFLIAGVEIASGVSVGVHVPKPGEDARAVMQRADAALYAAKAAGSGFELFDPARHRQFLERYQIELELRNAPARGQLVLHYQPIVELATRRTVGVEALIRWQHPTRGFLNPAAFIAIAEESGAIVDVGRWVIRQACADARSWQDRILGAAQVGVAVNVSRRQLRHAGIIDDVSDALTASGLSPASLTLEITETALMADTDEIVALLHKFKALGVDLAMDDFGTGYSSLAQLRTLPIDVLKIDKAFVDGIARQDEEWVLAAAIIRLAGSLDKRTLAEGVEHTSQLAHLRSLGCELAQGYLFARPMPLAELEALLATSPVPA